MQEIGDFFRACEAGDVAALPAMLQARPEWVREMNPTAPHPGWTGLHAAARAGRADVVRLLLQHGAEPNVREAGDNTSALHWAAASGDVETVQALLDAGAEPMGSGDAHQLEVIGWATVWRQARDIPQEVVALLLDRGARHHIFSAIAMEDPIAVRELVQRDRTALHRRMSPFEEGLTPLHFAIARRSHGLLDLLLELGADLEAEDQSGRTALVYAIMRGDREAVRRLRAAGAKELNAWTHTGDTVNLEPRTAMTQLGASVKKGVPMIGVRDIARTLDWYASIGFTEIGRYEENGVVNWGMVSFGASELMFMPAPKTDGEGIRLWFYTSNVDQIYETLRAHHVAAMLDKHQDAPLEFVEDIYDPFYGGRQFSIRDPNGYQLIFLQEE
jgi:ankyrin repeat protein